MPEISIIVPVYNVEDYLKECLDSLLAQTFLDYELICINDGSTDGSLSILRQYAATDARIRLISKENEGYGKTMNRGLSEARAPYIGIVESDDFVKPEMFETLYKAMQGEPVDLVKCNFYKYTVASGTDIGYSQEYPKDIYGKMIEPIDHPDIYSANSSIWAALYDREFLNKNRIRFNETPGASYQDISFQFKVLSCAKKMKIIEDALLYYRTDNLLSSVHSPYKIYCICDEIHAIERYIEEQSGERQKKLWPLLTKRKYYDYRWNFGRLAPEFRFAFYEKMVKEFKEDQEAGRFKGIEWLYPGDKEGFEKMMEDPFSYFVGTIKEEQDDRVKVADLMNDRLAEIGFFSTLQKEDMVVIYGAGKVGRYVAGRLKQRGIEEKKLLFAVTDKSDMEQILDGIQIENIDEVLERQKDRLVLVAVKGDKKLAMLNHLVYLDAKKVILIDDKIHSYIR